jgi:hypothetical protein
MGNWHILTVIPPLRIRNMGKIKKKIKPGSAKEYEKIKLNMSFEEAMKRALTTPIPNSKVKSNKKK